MRAGETRVQSDVGSIRESAGWFATLRVRDWAHFLVLPLASHEGDMVALVRGLCIAFCILAFGFLLNGIADREMDGSRRKNPLVAVQNLAAHLWLTALLATVALGLSASAPRSVVVATSVALASGTAYSVGPRLKRIPLVGTFSNVLHFAPLLWLGAGREGVAPGIWTLGCCFSLLILQNQVLHEAADEVDDRRGGVTTTWQAMGRSSSAVLMGLLGVALALVAHETPALAGGGWVVGVIFGVGFGVALYAGGGLSGVAERLRVAHRVAAAIAGTWIFVAIRVVA